MPMYEYYCQACSTRFEELRSHTAAEQPAICPTCQQPNAQRVIALVASFARSATATSSFETAAAAGDGGGCCSGGGCSCSF